MIPSKFGTGQQIWTTTQILLVKEQTGYLINTCLDQKTRVQTTFARHTVFHKNSQNAQHLVAKQLAIALYHFGHFGNAASTLKVALWSGVGYGTVDLIIKRVMTAVCWESFQHRTLHWADESEKEAAKMWVEENSCPAWRDGWLMVDGTLVPLFAHPGFYGNTWYDRKSNYSMNVQVHVQSILVTITY